MSTGAYVASGLGTGRVIRSAPGDLKHAVDRGEKYWLLGLRNPYESGKCPECVRAHSRRKLLEWLGGDFIVGARFEDVRMEVVVERTVARSADFTEETPGDPNRRWEL